MTTRIVVLADTHMPRRAKELPTEVLSALQRADMVIHLGDFTETALLEVLQTFAPVFGVHGNNDSEEIRTLFPATRRLDIEGHTLALIHGDLGGRTALAAARAVTGADVVLFGHSHHPWCSREDGRLLFNPGSPTDRRWSPHRSFGLLVFAEEIEPLLVPLP
jgi:putative phosphoesterase